jgi:hypothetical protein
MRASIKPYWNETLPCVSKRPLTKAQPLLKHDPASDYTKRREYISSIYDNAKKEMDIPKVGKFETEFLKF